MFDLSEELDVPAAEILQWLIDNGLTEDWKDRYRLAFILDLYGHGSLDTAGNMELITGHLINFEDTYLVRTISTGVTELLPFDGDLWEQAQTMDYLEDLTADAAWEFLVDHGIATEDELTLLDNVHNTSLDTLHSVLYARTGYQDFGQYYAEEVV